MERAESTKVWHLGKAESLGATSPDYRSICFDTPYIPHGPDVPLEIRQKLTGDSSRHMNKQYTHSKLETVRELLSPFLGCRKPPTDSMKASRDDLNIWRELSENSLRTSSSSRPLLTSHPYASLLEGLVRRHPIFLTFLGAFHGSILAQAAELLTCNQQVVGSSPPCRLQAEVASLQQNKHLAGLRNLRR
jgi:hypothetical protein